jgi:hypothetical protein
MLFGGSWHHSRFQKRLLYLANSLVDQPIGLNETDDGV